MTPLPVLDNWSTGTGRLVTGADDGATGATRSFSSFRPKIDRLIFVGSVVGGGVASCGVSSSLPSSMEKLLG